MHAEAEKHHCTYEREENQIEYEQDGTNGNQTGKGMRLDSNESCKAASRHGERVPSPGEVMEAGAER